MTSTETAAETWIDVDERLRAQDAREYQEIQQEAEAAETQHDALYRELLHGSGQVDPLEMERATSRKHMAHVRLMGIQNRQRIRRNEASVAHMPVVADRARAVAATLDGDDSRLEQARRKLAAAVAELREVAGEHNAALTDLFAEAAGTFTVAVAETVDGREVFQSKRVHDEVAGVRVRWDGIVNGGGGRVAAVIVDGTSLEPLAVDRMMLAEVADALPAALAEPVRRVLNPFGLVGRSQ
ncbi:hypothetical protein QOZ88_19315 [Blastococcus sp. BMG 814]|uniref:DUF222 domain-containing protein n=1 Tax=Blastococcus carthaginiensis TaxID=3050034 RepID=A0ABT9IGS8_9ACTN|nr:hypothetical protein [Blastococcus carthaginiensis]MDP5184788.1 hypothetical protein [Blastococcus carthaginiensis]